MSQGPTREVKAARYRHRCCWCNEEIAVGEPYKYYALFGRDGVWTERFHPECHAAMDDVLGAPGSHWWIPGDYPRGSTQKIQVLSGEEDIPW